MSAKTARYFFYPRALQGMGGALVLALMLFLYMKQPFFLRQIDNRIYDALLTSRTVAEPSPVPVIIDIDEEALGLYGQWPWPRYRLALLLEEAGKRGAAAIALDILLSEPDRSSPVAIREYLRADLGLDVGFTGLPSAMGDYDALLADVVAKYPVVLGMYARFDDKGAPSRSPEEKAGGKSRLPKPVGNASRSRPGDPPPSAYVHKSSSATAPLEVLHKAAPVGLINMSPDSDGYVRHVPMVAQVEGGTYVNLGLRALMTALGRGSILSVTGPDGLESLKVGQYSIPVSPQGNFTVPFTGGSHVYPYISAARVLDGSLPKDAFAGKILFVGTSAPGLLDIRATPYDRIYPGVEVHAAALDAVLTGRSISIPSWTPGMQAFCIIFAGIAAAVVFIFARPLVYTGTGVVLLATAFFGAWYFFRSGFFVSPLYPALTICLEGGVLLLMRFRQEEQQKIVLRQAFSRYVAPEVVQRITEQQGDFFAGEERELSIMFTDIRGFTTISENLDPKQVVSLLNRYFTPMTALVKNSGGTLDKFIGDALMAFWNAPLNVPEHPLRALNAALRMLEELVELNDELKRDFGCRISMGAGIHTGKAYVGNMGSDDLVNYTLIGDNVNLASRLEGLCSQFGVDVVVSAATMSGCLEHEAAAELFSFVPLDVLRVKGREQPVSVYMVIRPAERVERAREIERYSVAAEYYRQGEFAAAFERFTALCDEYPHVVLYQVYTNRIAGLLTAPPADWDGVWTLESK